MAFFDFSIVIWDFSSVPLDDFQLSSSSICFPPPPAVAQPFPGIFGTAHPGRKTSVPAPPVVRSMVYRCSLSDLLFRIDYDELDAAVHVVFAVPVDPNIEVVPSIVITGVIGVLVHRVHRHKAHILPDAIRDLERPFVAMS
jgi:hypothetical protein